MANNSGRFYKLFINNLPWTVSQHELRQYFSKFGPVSLSTVVFDKKTGLSRKFGFITFGNRQGFEDAQSVTEHKLEGSVLRVSPAGQDNQTE